MTTEPPILEVEKLTVAYDTPGGRIDAVDGVSFRLARREVLGLVGESGSGKSSVGLALVRYLPDNGRIAGGAVRFFGTDLAMLEGAELRHARGQRIAMVYQDPAGALNPSMRIGRQIEEVFAVRGERDRAAMRSRTLEILEAVRMPDPNEAYDRYPHQFSGGQQQRIVIAMALAMEPDLLILDEPTTGLDVSVEAEILDLFSDLRERIAAGILFISHNIAVVSRICDRVGVMHRGRLVEIGPTRDVLDRAGHDYTRRLLASRIPFGTVRPQRTMATPRSLLDARSLSKSYRSVGRRVDAIRDVSLALPAGSVLGLVGESGSGKTTTARVIAGLITADGGEVRLEGDALAPTVAARSDDQRRAVQMVFQNPDSTLNPRHSVGSILRRAARRLRGVTAPESARLATAALDAVRLDRGLLDALPGELSGGQKQRVAIARAFIGEAKLVLCDEPTSALDVSIQATILELLIELQDRLDTSYLFISHDLAVVRYISDTIAVMYLGEIVEHGPAAGVFETPQHPYTQMLLSSVLSVETAAIARLAANGPTPSLLRRPEGCPFHPRCPRKVGPECETAPPWRAIRDGHRYRCVLPPDAVSPAAGGLAAAAFEGDPRP